MTRYTPPPARELLTPAEVAQMFRVDPKTVTRWALAGKLNAVRTLGLHRRYYADEVAALLAGGTVPAAPQIAAPAAEPEPDEPAPAPRKYPLSAPHRPELGGYRHSITVERLTKALAAEVNMDHEAGRIVMVERHDGDVAKVMATIHQDDPEPYAEQTAKTYGADYIPAGAQ